MDELAGNLAVVAAAVEGVIADAFVARAAARGGRPRSTPNSRSPSPAAGSGSGVSGLAFGWAWREMVCGTAFPYALVAVADLDGFQVERVRTPAPPCARPGPRRPGRCWRAATRWRSWSPRGIRTTGTPRSDSSAVGIAGVRPKPVPAGFPAGQRGLPGLGMGAAVVFGFDPGCEQPVELQQRGGDRRPRRRRGPRWPVSVTSTRNCSRTVRKNRSILPRPWGRPGAECTRRTPSFAQARNSHASTNAEPLST